MILHRRQTRSVRWLLLIAVAMGGCNSQSSDYDATVHGTVTIDGELAKSGTVTFFPAAKGPAAVGVVSTDGSYALRIGQGNASDLDQSKIPSGDYVATVTVTGPTDESKAPKDGGPLPLGPQLMADKYMSRDTSELKFDIEPGLNVINITLDGPWANPPPVEEKEEGDEPNAEDGEPTADPPAATDAAAPPAESPDDDPAAAAPEGATAPAEEAQPAPSTETPSNAEGQP